VFADVSFLGLPVKFRFRIQFVFNIRKRFADISQTSDNKQTNQWALSRSKQYRCYKQGEYFMREVTANTIGKKADTNPSDQKLLEKNQRDLLRRERIRKFGEQLGFFEHGLEQPTEFDLIKPQDRQGARPRRSR
jgi:hypothetical protein